MADVPGPIPRAPDKLGSPENPREFYMRVRRAIDRMAVVLNSLISSGVIIRLPGRGGHWTINKNVFNITDGGVALGYMDDDPEPSLMILGPAGPAGPAGLAGRVIFDHFANGASVSTNGTEDDLYSDTTPANILAVNGDTIEAEYCVTIAAHALSTDQIRAYFAGTKVLDSGANTFASGGTANIWITLIRESSSVVRVKAELVPSGITLQPVVTYTRITGLTLTGTNILKITGIASGTGAAAGDITAVVGKVKWLPHA